MINNISSAKIRPEYLLVYFDLKTCSVVASSLSIDVGILDLHTGCQRKSFFKDF